MASCQLKPSESQSGCNLFATTKTTHNTRWGQDVTAITTRQRVCCCRMLKDSLGTDVGSVGNMSDTYLTSATCMVRANGCHQKWENQFVTCDPNNWTYGKHWQFSRTVLERGLMFLCSIRCRKYLWKTPVWIYLLPEGCLWNKVILMSSITCFKMWSTAYWGTLPTLARPSHSSLQTRLGDTYRVRPWAEHKDQPGEGHSTAGIWMNEMQMEAPIWPPEHTTGCGGHDHHG